MLSAQEFAEDANPFVDVLLLQQERREEANDRVMGAVEEHALGESLLDNRAAWNLEIDSLDESAPAHFFRGGVIVHQLLKLLV